MPMKPIITSLILVSVAVGASQLLDNEIEKAPEKPKKIEVLPSRAVSNPVSIEFFEEVVPEPEIEIEEPEIYDFVVEEEQDYSVEVIEDLEDIYIHRCGCAPAPIQYIKLQEFEEEPPRFEPEILAYPNPSTGPVSLRIKTNRLDYVYGQVYDMSGRMVQEIPLQESMGELEIPFTIKDNGMYIARILINNLESLSTRILIQK